MYRFKVSHVSDLGKLDVLVWVGCAGSYDARYRKVMEALFYILDKANIVYGVLGKEEGCTGDPARRSGHEYVFQMQALQNIETLRKYKIERILTSCPHCYHTLKDEYPALGGHYQVMHHTQYIFGLLRDKKIKIGASAGDSSSVVTYHDSCYLGRGHGIYEVPRSVLRTVFQSRASLREMRSHGKQGMCCGAGGAQLFKEPEKGTSDIHAQRALEAIQTGAEVVATACPFCKLMLMDGIAEKGKKIAVQDIAEIVANRLQTSK